MLYQAPSPQQRKKEKDPPQRETNKLRLFLKRSSEPLLNLQNAAQQVNFWMKWRSTTKAPPVEAHWIEYFIDPASFHRPHSPRPVSVVSSQLPPLSHPTPQFHEKGRQNFTLKVHTMAVFVLGNEKNAIKTRGWTSFWYLYWRPMDAAWKGSDHNLAIGIFDGESFDVTKGRTIVQVANRGG